MAAVIEVVERLQSFFSSEVNLFLTLLFFTLIIVGYSVSIFYFYRFLARKNIINLNLNQYNNYEDQNTVKFFAGLFYILEYIILLPIITLFWFAVLSVLVFLLSEGMSTNLILLVSTALITSIRITSYISENLSKELAKVIPLTLLAIAITQAKFFEITFLITKISGIPSLFKGVSFYLLFIITIELILRASELISQLEKNKIESGQ